MVDWVLTVSVFRFRKASWFDRSWRKSIRASSRLEIRYSRVSVSSETT